MPSGLSLTIRLLQQSAQFPCPHDDVHPFAHIHFEDSQLLYTLVDKRQNAPEFQLFVEFALFAQKHLAQYIH